jgi:hypothetical protein
MVFEHLQDYVHFEDSTSGFLQSFQLCFHIAQGHIPTQIAHVLGMTCLLTMTKLSNGVRPIAVKETLYQLTSYILCFQFYEGFATHFSPHYLELQLKVVVK